MICACRLFVHWRVLCIDHFKENASHFRAHGVACTKRFFLTRPRNFICQMQQTIVRLYIHDPIINRTGEMEKKERKVHIKNRKKERSFIWLDKHKICIQYSKQTSHRMRLNKHSLNRSPSTATNRLSYRLLQLLFGSKCLVTHGTINAHTHTQ